MKNLKNLNGSLNLSNTESPNLQEENDFLKNKIKQHKKKYHNLKRSKLRLKKLLNDKIKEKEQEINKICEDHYFKINKLVEEHDNKTKQLDTSKPQLWEWETIETLELKKESDR